MLLVGLIVLGVAVAAIAFFAGKQGEKSYVSFPCSLCGATVRVSVAESLRRLGEAHRGGTLDQLGKAPIRCMKCGSPQAASWLLHPRTKEMLTGLDESAYKALTAAEYMSLVHADSKALATAPAAEEAPAPKLPEKS